MLSVDEMARLLMAGDQYMSLASLVQALHSQFPHADVTGVTVSPVHGRPRSLVTTGTLADCVQQIQAETLEGPSLDAADGEAVVRVEDLATDPRWPHFAPAAAEFGIRSILSTRLHLKSDRRAALNFYALRTAAFSDDDVVTAALFGSFVSLALDAELARQQIADLEIALRTNRQIGAAIGIVMARRAMTVDQAFSLLREASQAQNRKLREIAAEIVETGALPALPPKPIRR